MTSKDKDIKIEFAPGCFDHFDGTQEELDELIAEIQNIFAGKTREEIESMSREVDFDELIDDDPGLAEILFLQVDNLNNPSKRKLN